MSNKTRLSQVMRALDQLSGINETQFEAISQALNLAKTEPGRDETGKAKIAMFDAKHYDTVSFLKENQERFAIDAITTPLNEQSAALAKGYKIVCIFVNDLCNAAVVKQLASIGVELIALRCAGFNNVDLAACEKAGIDVVRVPAYSPHAVAEHAVALMLMLNRKLHRAYLRNKSGQFVLDGLVGFDMYGKTVGVVGTGKIGQCVIDILSGFGCHILAFDKFPDESLSAKHKLEYTSMEELQKRSDIITLHAPLTDETKHIINAESIESMKTGVMLINTSRGALVDTVALIKGLKCGKIDSAGLDVYEEEADIFFHDLSGQVMQDEVFARLMTFDNVVVTSHQAFLTKEALANIAQTTLDNVEEYLAGKRNQTLTNRVRL